MGACRLATMIVLTLLTLLGVTNPSPRPDGDVSAVEHRLLARQLERLREITLQLREARPDLFGPSSLDGARPAFRAATALDLVAAQLGQELALLERTVLALGDPVLEPWTHVVGRRAEGTECTFEVLLPGGVTIANTSLSIANVGRVAVVAPRVLIDGGPTWHDADALLASALGDATEPGEIAKRLWALVVRGRRHAEPAHPHDECHDPVKLLNVYGYGFCDDAANALAALARKAGLAARVWALSGHVVPELAYDGAWHMFDPDHEAYYLDAVGNVASVEQLADDPALLANAVRLPGHDGYLDEQRLIDVLTSRGDNRIAGYRPIVDFHDMDVTLRPGERFVRRWSHRGYRFASGHYQVPAGLGNGEWILERELVAGEPLPVIDFRLPYPILDGQLTLAVADPSLADELLLEVRTASVDWQQLAPAHVGEGTLSWALGGLLRNGSGDPDYALDLRLTGRSVLPEGVPRLSVVLVFQHAPAALPALGPGRNTVRFSSETPGALVDIAQRYRQLTP